MLVFQTSMENPPLLYRLFEKLSPSLLNLCIQGILCYSCLFRKLISLSLQMVCFLVARKCHINQIQYCIWSFSVKDPLISGWKWSVQDWFFYTLFSGGWCKLGFVHSDKIIVWGVIYEKKYLSNAWKENKINAASLKRGETERYFITIFWEQLV